MGEQGLKKWKIGKPKPLPNYQSNKKMRLEGKNINLVRCMTIPDIGVWLKKEPWGHAREYLFETNFVPICVIILFCCEQWKALTYQINFNLFSLHRCCNVHMLILSHIWITQNPVILITFSVIKNVVTYTLHFFRKSYFTNPSYGLLYT